jgi:hypothetical protein
MSYALIRQALEVRLNALTPPLPTAWENSSFIQPVTAFQRVSLLPANTSNPTFGDTLAEEKGILQVTLCYPQGNGPVDAMTRAELLRAWFPRGLSISAGGITVRIRGKPSIGPAQYEPGIYALPVSIPYFTYV